MSAAAAPILALAGDPGGASALAPVLEILKAEAPRPLLVCAYREAFGVFAKRGLDPQPQHAWQDRLSALVANASLLVTGTSVNGLDFERKAAGIARECGIPSLAVLDFWSNYRLRFVDGHGNLTLPDRIAIMDDLAEREMVAAGFPRERLVVTGQPAFDALLEARREFTDQRRAMLRRELGIDDPGILAVFVSQPLCDLHGGPAATKAALGYDELEVFALCRDALATLARRRGQSCVMAVRPHPREQPGKFVETSEEGFRTVVWNTPDRLEAVLAADLVVGMTSALLYEAACMSCHVVSIQPGATAEDDPLPSNRTGESQAVRDASALEDALEKALSKNDRPRAQLIGSEECVRAATATSRVASEIMRLLTWKETR